MLLRQFRSKDKHRTLLELCQLTKQLISELHTYEKTYKSIRMAGYILVGCKIKGMNELEARESKNLFA